MAPERYWTKAMRQAWEFALSTVERGLSGAAGLREYREGGGKIRTADWYTIMREARRAYELPRVIPRLPTTAPLPSSAYVETEYDYHRKYIAVAEFTGYNPQTGEKFTGLVSVESNISLSLPEWQQALISRAIEGESIDPNKPQILERVWFYRRRD